MGKIVSGIFLALLFVGCSSGIRNVASDKDYLGVVWSSVTGKIYNCYGDSRVGAMSCAQEKCPSCEYAGSCAVNFKERTTALVSGRQGESENFYLDMSCENPEKLSDRQKNLMTSTCASRGFKDCKVESYSY
jgi:hypothetical protein